MSATAQLIDWVHRVSNAVWDASFCQKNNIVLIDSDARAWGGRVATNSTVLCVTTGGFSQVRVREEQEMQHVDRNRKDRGVAFGGWEGKRKGVWQHTEGTAKGRCLRRVCPRVATTQKSSSRGL